MGKIIPDLFTHPTIDHFWVVLMVETRFKPIIVSKSQNPMFLLKKDKMKVIGRLGLKIGLFIFPSEKED